MKYNNRLHNFDDFFKNWSTEDTYYLYGASKDAVQFIETFDNLLPEKNKIKIDLIIDDYIDKEKVYESIYDINPASYKPDNYVKKNNRKSIKVKNLNDVNLKENKIIITSDANYNKIKKGLEILDLKENINFCNYKKIAAIWPFKISNLVHLWRTDILLTERCTLNCTYCNMYMPHYKKAKDRSLDQIKKDFEDYFKVVDFVSIFHLVGGEPLLYKYLNEVIDLIGTKYRNKIGRLLLTSNGTLVPKPETIKLFKKYNLLISLSDYTDGINYKRRYDQMIEKLKVNKIEFFERKNIEWNDFGDPNKVIFNNELELIKHFDSCTAPYRGLNSSKYYYCHLNTSAILSELHEENDNDFIHLNENTNKEEILKFDIGFLKKGYATFCSKCNGCNTGIDAPVSFKDQGLRT